MSGAPTPELPGSYPTPNSLAALELPSRVGNLGPEPPRSLPPRGGTDQIYWGLENGAQKKLDTDEWGGGGELHRDGQGTGGQTDKFLELLPDKRKIKQSNPLGQEQDS